MRGPAVAARPSPNPPSKTCRRPTPITSHPSRSPPPRSEQMPGRCRCRRARVPQRRARSARSHAHRAAGRLATERSPGRKRRDMHEQSETRIRLPSGPVERVIVEKVAEIAPAERDVTAGRPEVLRCAASLPAGSPVSRRSGPSAWITRPRRQSLAGIGAQRGAVMRRTLDAERIGALADAEVNHYMRLQALVEARHERGSIPFGRQYLDMQLAIEFRRMPRRRSRRAMPKGSRRHPERGQSP